MTPDSSPPPRDQPDSSPSSNQSEGQRNESQQAPSVPLAELYENLQSTALEYDLRPYTAAGRFTLLSAPPKCGKSTFTALYAHAKTTGGMFLGQELEPAPVLYVAPDENRRDVARRFRSFGTPGNRLEVWRDHKTPIARIAHRARDIGAELIVLDTLLRVAGIADENDNAEWDEWFHQARQHSDDSSAVWFAVHHDRKSGGTDGEGIRGASSIFGSVDVALSLQKSDEAPKGRILQVEGTRLDTADPLVVKLNQERPKYEAVGETDVVSILEDAALERLQDVLTDSPRPVSEIHTTLQKRYPEEEGDVPESTVRNRLERLRSTGLVVRHGEGGRRDPYQYALSSSATPSEATEPSPEAEGREQDTSSIGRSDGEPSAPISDSRSVVSQPEGPERLSVKEEGSSGERLCPTCPTRDAWTSQGRDPRRIGPAAEMCGACKSHATEIGELWARS